MPWLALLASFSMTDSRSWDDCSLLGGNSNQWRPVKYIITIQPPMVKNDAQETFTGCYSFTWFLLLWKFYWAGTRTNKYNKLRTVSLRDVNSLTCIVLYFSGRGKAPPHTSPPLDDNPVTVKCYEDNCHYVILSYSKICYAKVCR